MIKPAPLIADKQRRYIRVFVLSRLRSRRRVHRGRSGKARGEFGGGGSGVRRLARSLPLRKLRLAESAPLPNPPRRIQSEFGNASLSSVVPILSNRRTDLFSRARESLSSRRCPEIPVRCAPIYHKSSCSTRSYRKKRKRFRSEEKILEGVFVERYAPSKRTGKIYIAF